MTLTRLANTSSSSVWRNYHLPVLLAIAMFSGGCNKQRTPDLYLIPAGYQGWVRIQYEVPGALPLRVERGYYAIFIDASGWAKTSSPIDEGLGRDLYSFYDPDAGTRLPPMIQPVPANQVWGKATVFIEGKYKVFFIGTEGDYLQKPEPDGELR